MKLFRHGVAACLTMAVALATSSLPVGAHTGFESSDRAGIVENFLDTSAVSPDGASMLGAASRLITLAGTLVGGGWLVFAATTKSGRRREIRHVMFLARQFRNVVSAEAVALVAVAVAVVTAYLMGRRCPTSLELRRHARSRGGCQTPTSTRSSATSAPSSNVKASNNDHPAVGLRIQEHVERARRPPSTSCPTTRAHSTNGLGAVG